MQASEQRQPIGSLRISRDVIATIAANAAKEVAGVHSLCPFPMVNLKGILSKRQIAKPVMISLADDIAVIDIQVVLCDGANIPSVSEKIQESVKESVQNMTGIAVSKVNIAVAGIHFDAPAKAVVE